MSYIHDALKKAQREKDLIAEKYGSIWSTYRYRPGMFKRKWLVAASLILVCVVFSAYSWLDLNFQPFSRRGASVHQAAANRHGGLKPDNFSGPGLDQTASKSVVATPTLPSPSGPDAGPDGVFKGNRAGLKNRLDKSIRASSTRAGSNNNILASRKEENREVQEPQKAPTTKPARGEATTLYSQAVALQKEGRLHEAKKLYEAALKGSANLVSALNNLGAIYIKEKNYAAARKVLEKAVKIEPNYVDPYYNLACLHALRKDVGQSLSSLKKAISLNEAARMWAKTDEDLENLYGHPEYEKIIAKTKSP